MSTRKIPGSKAGRYVRLTTYHLLVLNVEKIRGLNLPDPHGLVQACSRTACSETIQKTVVCIDQYGSYKRNAPHEKEVVEKELENSKWEKVCLFYEYVKFVVKLGDEPTGQRI
jgi:hypothetical protein